MATKGRFNSQRFFQVLMIHFAVGPGETLLLGVNLGGNFMHGCRKNLCNSDMVSMLKNTDHSVFLPNV